MFALCRDVESLLLFQVADVSRIICDEGDLNLVFSFVQSKLWRYSDFVCVMYVTLCHCKGGLWTE